MRRELVVADRAGRAREVTRRWSTTSRGLVLLVADPDTSQREPLVPALEANGVSCTWCLDGAETLVQYGKLEPAAMLMSPGLEVVDAATVVHSIRQRGTLPILLGVGPGDSAAAGPVLIAGATAAVSRPYDPTEIMRRLDAEIPHMAARSRLTYGPLELDPRSYVVRLEGAELHGLALKQFELLRLLMMNADLLVTVEQIRQALWGDAPHPPSSDTINVHVTRLRSRIGGPTVLRTVRGLGYRLTFPDALRTE